MSYNIPTLFDPYYIMYPPGEVPKITINIQLVDRRLENNRYHDKYKIFVYPRKTFTNPNDAYCFMDFLMERAKVKF